MVSEPVWKIPEPLATCEVRHDADTVTVLRRHGNASGPRLVLSHGNGLAVDLYYPFWSLLEDDFDLVLYDLRNHGWNRVGARDRHNVPTLISDHREILAAIDQHFGAKPKTGIFHSVSGLIALLSSGTAALMPSARFDPLAAQILLDPALRKPGASPLEFDAAAERAAEITSRRGYRFASREAYADFLAYLPAFTRVVPGVRDLVARTTLRRSADGQAFELRCPRDYEAQIVGYIRSYSPLVDLHDLDCPTKVIGADPTLPYAYLPTLDLGDMDTVDYDFLPDTTHFLLLEKPAECVAIIREFLAAHRLM